MENLLKNSSPEKQLQMPLEEKNLGTEYFKENKLKQAIVHYSNSLEVLAFLFEKELVNSQEEAIRFINEIEIPVNLNMALCFLKLKQYHQVIFHSSKVYIYIYIYIYIYYIYRYYK